MRKTKKNWALRMMFLVLAFTLISSSLMSGTLAKYVTQGSGTDTARVAKWGVEITGTGTLFSETYVKKDSTYTLTTDSVISLGQVDKVVAPGTSGTLGTIVISGSPEVASRISVAVTSSSFTGWDYDLDKTENGGGGSGTPDYYEPIVWKVNNVLVTAAGETDGSFDALVAYLNAFKFDFAPNATISVGTGLAISWEWEFSINDAGDTYYGNKLLDPPGISLAFDVTVTQID